MMQSPSGNDLHDNHSIRAQARVLLSGKWNNAALVALIYVLVTGLASIIPIVGALSGLILSGPFGYGLAVYFLKISRNQSVQRNDLFAGFSLFGKTLVTYILMILFVLLWCVLLIIPGIIAALSYALTFYILADNPELKPMEALRRSALLMKGRKMELFLLAVSFIGWGILSIFTLGIGLLWLIPYIQTSFCLFYRKASSSQIASAPSASQ
jgi:uncharacterized membrane protein